MRPVFHKPKHAHKACVTQAKSRATKLVSETGKKFGANQLLVLDALLQDHKAVGAYDIVERIAKTGDRLQPVQVYRALDGLISVGLVHRLQSRNAYIACNNSDECDAPQLLYCSSCEQVAEISAEDLSNSIAEIARQNHFQLELGLVEMIGLCPECADAR